MIELSYIDTLIGLIPLAIGIVAYGIILQESRVILLAGARMTIQLIAMGYALTFIFDYHLPWLGCTILMMMLAIASTIAIRPLKHKSVMTYVCALTALGIAGGLNLFWVLIFVLKQTPWYQPQWVIPLAGIIFANGLNGISLAAEQYERHHTLPHSKRAKEAFQTAMIPLINNLLAVGIVSLPGTMTGQILSGVSPLIAVRYQIIIMSMIASTTIIAIAIYFELIGRFTSQDRPAPQEH